MEVIAITCSFWLNLLMQLLRRFTAEIFIYCGILWADDIRSMLKNLCVLKEHHSAFAMRNLPLNCVSFVSQYFMCSVRHHLAFSDLLQGMWENDARNTSRNLFTQIYVSQIHCHRVIIKPCYFIVSLCVQTFIVQCFPSGFCHSIMSVHRSASFVLKLACPGLWHQIFVSKLSVYKES